MKKLLASYRKKWIFKWFLPGILFLWVIFLALQLNPEVPLSIIQQNFSSKNYIHWSTKELLAHKTAEGEFTAGQDNLGIIAVRFNTYVRINSDSVIFRIKEKGQQNWFYQGTYKVDQFQPNQEFTFGFPIQPASKGKTYIFQVESIKGVHKDAIAISPIEPVFSAKYQFTKTYFRHNPTTVLKFVSDKLISVYTDFSTSFYFLAYLYLGLIGFVGYYLWLFLGIKVPYQKIVISIFLLFVGTDILVQTLPHRGISLILLAISWLALCVYYEYSSNITFTGAIIWFCLSIFVRLIGFMVTAEYIIHWFYIFLVIGCIQFFIEAVYKRHKRMDAIDFWKKEILPLKKDKNKTKK